jgi:hypothetical protein
MIMRPAFLAIAGLMLAAPALAQEARLLDGFEDPAEWEADASDGVDARAYATGGSEGGAIALAFDFNGYAGHAFISRPLALDDLPENYEIRIDMRGEAPVNALEIKFVDESGETVWWRRLDAFQPSQDWETLTIRRRQIEFAWGPEKQDALERFASVELVVVAGEEGGAGEIAFDNLVIEERPMPPETPPLPVAEASSGDPGAAFDGDARTAWRAGPGAQTLTADLGYDREFGGLTLDWADGLHASDYAVSLSADGESWREARAVSGGDGGRDHLLLTESEARFIRLEITDGPGEGYGLTTFDVRPLDYGETASAFFTAIAAEAARGTYPRGLHGEQSYWTVVGVDGGASASALLSEDGAIEIGRGGFSVEPFVIADGEVFTWADVEIGHALEDGHLPIPTAEWRTEDWTLSITAFADGEADDPRFIVRYEFENLSDTDIEAELVLAARPFQVNPPAQFLNLAGGVSEISRLDWDGQSLTVNGQAGVRPAEAPASVSLHPHDAPGFPARALPEGGDAAPSSLEDPAGFASAVMRFPLSVSPGERREAGLVASGKTSPVPPEAALAALQESVADLWRAELDTVRFEAPDAAQPLVDTLKASLAHMLLSRDGAILWPGTRSYARSWIRDGAMMAEALARLDRISIAREYAEWFSGHLFENGKVPCCVDARGSDPTPENDSHGEYIFLVAEIYRYTGDRGFLERLWPGVKGAADYMEALIESERTEENRERAMGAYHGLLPPSISHEGYADRPAYSHWDNFWGLKGYEDAAWLASELGLDDEAGDLAARAARFRESILASLAVMPDLYGIDFIPGAADRGDFDATSTTIAINPAGLETVLPPAQLEATFERAWEEFLARRDGQMEWDVYTPYELRQVGTFVRLGWRGRALELLDFYMNDRRPGPWAQWAEVVGRDEREPRFIGDMPHAWISSDYIRAAFDMFAYARPADESLVLAAGLDPDWLDEGVSVAGLPTPWGELAYSIRREDGAIRMTVEGEAAPPGGFALPHFGGEGAATVNGEPADWAEGALRFERLPAGIMIEEAAR